MIFRSRSLRHFNNRPSVDTVSWSFTAFFFEQQTRLTIPSSSPLSGLTWYYPPQLGWYLHYFWFKLFLQIPRSFTPLLFFFMSMQRFKHYDFFYTQSNVIGPTALRTVGNPLVLLCHSNTFPFCPYSWVIGRLDRLARHRLHTSGGDFFTNWEPVSLSLVISNTTAILSLLCSFSLCHFTMEHRLWMTLVPDGCTRGYLARQMT